MRDSTDVKSVRAPAYTSGVTVPVRRIDRIQRGTAEPPSVTLLRHILNPTVIVVTLLLTVLAYGASLSQQYLALAALAFLISAQVVSDPVLDSSGTRGISMLLQHRIFSEWLLVSAALLLLAFALKVTELFSRRVILTWFALTPFVVVAAQVGFRRYAAFSAMRGKILQSHIIVGANDVGARLARRLRANPHLGTFRGFFDDRRGERLPELPEEQLLGGTADIANYVRWNSVSSIYICLPMRPDERVTRLLEELKDTTASVYFVPDLYAFDTMQAQVCDLDGIPLFAVRETPFNGMNGVLKRGSDIVFATILLLMIWPVLLALAAGVRLSSPGPVLFRQRRYGLDGQEILVYKFRSMTVAEDGAVVKQATKNDARVTPFGAFLRRSSLDELPQFINVLQGRMSVVGPRPHAVAHNELYRRRIRGYMIRHKVRPGITGLAQVNGFRGETDTLEKMEGRIEYDLAYLRNWSLWLDLKIVLQTVAVVLRRQNAY
jgi:putative colanic acid biosynthesis UDP-glucose lipid carrier transferase